LQTPCCGDCRRSTTPTVDRSAPTQEVAINTPNVLEVAPDAGALAAAVAGRLVAVVTAAVSDGGVAHVALTGGSMGGAVVTALADLDLDPGTWHRVHLWWGDERFVPAGDQDRNDQQARDAGLDRLPIPAGQVHAVPAGSDPAGLDDAAQAYAAELAGQPDAVNGVPAFDVVLLGVGPDGHVASLFPGRPELGVTDATTVAVTGSPKPPPLRVSLTLPTLRSAQRVWFVVSGADKSAAVAAAWARPGDRSLPASLVRGTAETVWWLDQAAAGGLSG